MKKYVIILFVLVSCGVYAQKGNGAAFKKGDRICFIGNSITHSGGYHKYFQLYNETRFPDENMAYFNCGVAGDVADGMIRRFEKDILSNKPTHAFLMTGMNDIIRSLYFKGEKDAENLKKRKIALDNYIVKTEKLAKMLIKNDVKPIFVTPSIYDQTAEIPRFNDFGANDALAICATHIRKMAEKYEAPLVDFHKVMGEINAKAQTKDPSFTIVGPDRIHPEDIGHLVMAFEIIKTISLTNLVSKTVIDARKMSVKEAIKSEVVFNTSNNDLTFKVKEMSLPFPIKNSLQKVNDLTPVSKTINNEILTIKRLRKGNYRLFIDSIEVGLFTKKELGKGINLANYANTPQNQQAVKVADIVNAYHKTQDSLRTISFVEYKMLNKYTGPDTTADKKEYLYAENVKSKGKSWYEWDKKNIKNYFKILPKEEKLWDRLKAIRGEIHNTNKPQWHIFKLVKE